MNEQEQEGGIALLEEYEHPSLTRLLPQGCQMITFRVDALRMSARLTLWAEEVSRGRSKWRRRPSVGFVGLS